MLQKNSNFEFSKLTYINYVTCRILQTFFTLLLEYAQYVHKNVGYCHETNVQPEVSPL